MSQTNERGGAISLGRLLPVLVILGGALAGAIFLREHLSFAALAENREALIAYRDTHYLLAVLGFMAIYVAIVGFSLPGATIATLAGGFLFGTFPGVLFNVGAATLGACAIFLAARWGFGDALAARMDAGSGTVQRFKAAVDRNQWSALFLMRLVPAMPFFLANLLPAFFGVPLRRYVVTTALGILPGGLVYTSIGAGLGQVFEAEDVPDLGVVFAPHILLPLLGLAALAALPMVIRAVRGKGVAQ